MRNSYRLIRMSFGVIREDTRVLLIQMGALLVTGMIWLIVGGTLYMSGYFSSETFLESDDPSAFMTPSSISVFVLLYVLSMAVYYFSVAYTTSFVLGVVRNTKQGFRETIEKVHANTGALLQFIALSSTVGVILRLLEDRLPLASALAARIAEGAWNLATVFAVPCIVDGSARTGTDAAKQSVSLLVRSFGENIVVRIGLGVVVSIVTLIWLGVCTTIAILTMDTVILALGTIVVGIVGFCAILFFVSVLQSVVTVMLYEYVRGGGETMTMEKELFKQMITPKKALSVFHHV